MGRRVLCPHLPNVPPQREPGTPSTNSPTLTCLNLQRLISLDCGHALTEGLMLDSVYGCELADNELFEIVAMKMFVLAKNC